MNWLERQNNALFRLTGIFLLLIVILGIWGAYQIGGVPNNSINTWTADQWNTINFLWTPILIYSLIYLLFAVLCFMRKNFVFLFIALFMGPPWRKGYIDGFKEIYQYGFIYPVNNMLGIFGEITFILSFIGALLWIRCFLIKPRT